MQQVPVHKFMCLETEWANEYVCKYGSTEHVGARAYIGYVKH